MNQATLTLTGLLFLISPVLAQGTPPAAQSTPVNVPENMVYVPAGDFIMGTERKDGSDDNQGTNTPLNANDARPRHTATTKAFFIDKTEVTNAQYQKFIEATGFAPPPDWPEGKFLEKAANWPVTRVNWYEATAYAKWAGKRLPTEIEWEKAARGTDGRNFPWGNEYRPANLNGDADALRDVGSFPAGASPYGALDMAGNVMEWTSTWFDAYPNAPTVQPDFGKKTLKVVRGGGTRSGNMLAQTWYRSVNRPLSRTMWVGFRCVKDVE
jgi:formylglycine-generating enzyme required for sulfatase activity